MSRKNQDPKYAKIVILGFLEVGKTSFLRQLTNLSFSQYYEATVGVDFKRDEVNFIEYWDAGGNNDFNINKLFLNNCHAVILCCDTTKGQDFCELNSYLQKIKLHSNTAQVFLVATKTDLVKERRVSDRELEKFAKQNNCELYFTSAKNNTGFDKLRTNLHNLSQQATQQHSNDLIGDLQAQIDGIKNEHFKNALLRFYSNKDNRHYDNALEVLIKGYNKLLTQSNPPPDKIKQLFSTFESKCKSSWTKTTFKLVAVVIITGIFSLLGMVAGATIGLMGGALAGVPLGPLAIASAASGASAGGVTGLALGAALGTMVAGIAFGATASSISAISLFKPSEQDKQVDRIVARGLSILS